MEVNKEMITNICTCSGKKLEEKYSFKDMSAMGMDKIKPVMKEIIKECAEENKPKEE